MKRTRGTIAACACACLLALTAAAPGAAAKASKPTANAAIVGGSTLTPTEPRFVVGLLSRGRMICSGTLISPTLVLTAAHCAFNPRLSVVTGRDRLSDASLGEVIAVADTIAHPDFNRRSPANDIAVILLASPSASPTAVLPTSAESDFATIPGQPLTAAGYGRQNPSFFGRPIVGDLRVLAMNAGGGCPKAFKRFAPVTMVCAVASFLRKRIKLRRTPCSGDSGGPIVSRLPDGRLSVVGVISFGRNPGGKLLGLVCGQGPTVSTRVSAFLPFIAPYLPPPPAPPPAAP